jgi:hypothetical protein
VAVLLEPIGKRKYSAEDGRYSQAAEAFDFMGLAPIVRFE